VVNRFAAIQGNLIGDRAERGRGAGRKNREMWKTIAARIRTWLRSGKSGRRCRPAALPGLCGGNVQPARAVRWTRDPLPRLAALPMPELERPTRWQVKRKGKGKRNGQAGRVIGLRQYPAHRLSSTTTRPVIE
jgi:hypothetical protein